MARIEGLVWAGNLREADQYCSVHNLDRNKYRYITRAESCYGLRPTVIFRIGTYWKHHDAHAIQSLVDVYRILGAHIETPDDSEWKGGPK